MGEATTSLNMLQTIFYPYRTNSLFKIGFLNFQKNKNVTLLAPVVQTLDSSIYRINHYPADKYYGNQLRYPADSDLSGG